MVNYEYENETIKKFSDLDVYKRSYNAALSACKDIAFKLPREEKYDLCSQISRSSKAIPRLIAEGFAKKTKKQVIKNTWTMHWQNQMKPRLASRKL